MATIFVDAGAFIALSVPSDDDNAVATRIYGGLLAQGTTLLTTNHIVDETCTWFLRRVSNGHSMALRFGDLIARATALADPSAFKSLGTPPGRMIVLYTTPEIERAAWDIFARYDTAGFSFTDCVSFAAMQALGIRKAFTFDKHYETMGFERL